MDNDLILMGKRLRELRQLRNISAAEMARVTGLSEEEYLRHEAGEVDSSFTFILRCAGYFEVDIGAIAGGSMPRLSYCTVTRKGHGTLIKQEAGFKYLHLAALLKNRLAEPFLVTAPPRDENDPIELTTHSGEEFDYVLSGRLKTQFDNQIEILEPGDSMLYDSSHPHGMIAVGGEPCVFLAVTINSAGGAAAMKYEPVGIMPHDLGIPHEECIYHRYLSETLDRDGYLKGVKFHYPSNFNFSFDVLDILAKKCPDKTALIHVDREHRTRNFSFREMSEESRRTANYFASLGIKKGDRVMLVLKRHYQFWFALTALHRIGAIAVPASNQLLEHDFSYRFDYAKIAAIVATADGGVADAVDAAAKNAPSLRVKILVNGSRDSWHDFNREVLAFSTEFARPKDVLAKDPALMFFSSGTTGYPKAVVHAMSYPLGHIITARWWQNVRSDGVHFTISDTGWGKALWGKIYGQWLCESAVLAYDFDRFHADDILEIFKEYNVTTFCAPPTMYRFFIKEDLAKHDLSSLKYACIAGEALNPEVFHRFREATGLKLMEAFGQTESTMLIGNLLGMEPKPGSMGRPSPQYSIALLDAEGRQVPAGETGEICVKAERGEIPGLFIGYYNDENATAAAWHDGFYHTGDTAWMDEDGYYWYVGRVDDLIKSSGYRIGPFEIESVIMELPYVLECAVVGVPDEIRGQAVKAFIVLTSGTAPDEALKLEIQNYVKQHTAPYKYPRLIEFVEAMPKTISGKIRRSELRKSR
ncbi:MAG: AMP-binding protein [Victivallaceae bacterium]|nr:AMP-binding protein [Victivallaceae bacterium]